MVSADDGVVFVVADVWMPGFSLLVVFVDILVVVGVALDEGEDGEGEGDSVLDRLLSIFE